MKPNSNQPAPERSLAAIVLTDAVSFSARMSVDEEGTLALIQRDLDLIAQNCECFGGQVLKSTGDGLLMSFYSAVQAVLCSQEVQKQLAKLAEGQSTEEYLQHRIGIHLGDVLFSHEDVLGNGVNIAARLQTKAAPGGICISQTVYDVVKARINLNVTFLGPLKLKNIQEPVTAYQIPPYGQSATMVVSAGSPDGVADQSPLEQAAQQLLQDPQNRRIKKLVFATYQGVWENDPKVLAQFDLVPLLRQLQQRHPTLISLEKALQTVASRLNRKDVYLAIVDTIVKTLDPLYESPDEDFAETSITSQTQIKKQQRQTAYTLSQQHDRQRIKKLLYAVIHSTWENDLAVLAVHNMEDLVVKVFQMAPAETDLSYHLERIVKRLNRQGRYTQLALIVTEAFHPLYQLSSAEQTSTQLKSAASDADGESTQLADETSFSSGETTTTETDMLSTVADDELTVLTRWESAELSGEQTLARVSDSVKAVLPSNRTETPTLLRDRANLYNLRMEIMRYTNPLRAKILLLSTVRSPFTASRQDWLTLKSKSLDDLIQATFEYCQTFSDLESKLTIMCHCVDNVSENLQAAVAIMKAMKPFYSQSS